MFTRRVVLASVVTVLIGCRHAAQPGAGVVARAGTSELKASRLAEIAAASAELPLRSGVVEALAMQWIGYSLLGLRTASGDRLLDRQTIASVAWPDVRAAVVDSFRTVRLAGRVRVTPQQVDSAFGAGDARFLRQILKRTTPAMPASERDSLRAVIAGIRARLAAGGSWDEANAQSDDPRSGAAKGALGLVRRGQLAAPLERAAFALAPGQLSGVVETSFGFLLIDRPKLEEVRDEFAAALRDRLAAPLDSAYAQDLLTKKHVQLVVGVPAAVRFAVGSPLKARGMPVALATYDGGRFTVGDLGRYLQFLPPAFQQQALSAPDGQLSDLVRSLVVRELQWRDADSAGITLPEERFRQIAEAYTQQVNRILTATGLSPDLLAAAASSHRARQLAAARRADRILEESARDPRLQAPLPPGLADYLLDHGSWEVFPNGIDQVMVEAAMMRSARRDSTGPGNVR